MKIVKFISVSVGFLICILLLVSSRFPDDPKKSGNKDNPLTVISSKQMDANNIRTWFRNNGNFNKDPSGNSGFEWPKGSGKFARYSSGLWMGALVGDDTLVALAEFDYEYLPGYVDGNGSPQGKDNPDYRIYIIDRNDTLSQDYRSWPFDQGAYGDSRGVPFKMGDQTMFFAYTDAYPESHNNIAGSTNPLKAQILQTNWSYKGANPYSFLSNTVFTEYRIINRSNQVWRKFNTAIWSDDDLGDSNDDAVGCDSLLDMTYMYNFDNNDPNYGTAPPAVAFQILRGPLVPSSGDTVVIIDPPTSGKKRNFPGKKVTTSSAALCLFKGSYQMYGEPSNYRETYRVLQGIGRSDTSWVNPLTGNITRYSFTGDPESNTGWNEMNTGDRRLIVCMGPVDVPPNDTVKIVYAQFIARGSNNRNSVSVLKNHARGLKRFYESDFEQIQMLPPPPITSGRSPGDGNTYLTLYDSTEDLTFENKLGGGTYRFQGYNIYQIRAYSPFPSTADTVLIKSFDILDDITDIYDSIYIPEYNSVTYGLVQKGNYLGIDRTLKVERDTFTSSSFKQGYAYKFAVSAYYYNPQGGLQTNPKVMHSERAGIKFVAQPPASGTVTHYQQNNYILTNQRDLGVYPLVTDPLKLLTASYTLLYHGNGATLDSLRWSFIRSNSGKADTLYKNMNLFNDPDQYGELVDGFELNLTYQHDSGIAKDKQISYLRDRVTREFRAWDYSPEGGEWFTAPDTNAIKTAKVITNRQFECRSLGISFPTTATFKNNKSRIFANGKILTPVLPGGRILTGGPLRKIKIVFGDSHKSMSYRYVPADTNYINTPCMGITEVPFSVFMVDELDSTGGIPRQVNTGFLDADSSGTWNPKGGKSTDFERLGGYEFTYIFASRYDSLPLTDYTSKNPGFASPVEGFPSLDIMYAWLPRAQFENGELRKWKDGDELTVWPMRLTRESFVPGLPVKYEFSVKGTQVNVREVASLQLNSINIFPNPYYGSSELEYNSTGEKFIYINNLPINASIYIYSLDGVLARKIDRSWAAVENSLEKWDLKNDAGAYVASGMYIIYVECPGIGAKTLKAAVFKSN